MAGRSGNPGGRPKSALNVQELARAHTKDAIRALVRGLNDPKHYVHAAQVLLERGWGKPVQPVQDEGQKSIGVLHLVAAREVSEEIERALAAGNGTAPPVIEGKPLQDTQQQKADRQISVSTSLPNLMQPALE
jgi:hypothetical protein